MKSCDQITLDYEKSKFTRIPLKDRLEMRMHKAMCPKCRKYFKDSDTLDTWLTRKFKHKGGDYTFTKEEKVALKKRLTS